MLFIVKMFIVDIVCVCICRYTGFDMCEKDIMVGNEVLKIQIW